MPTADNNSRRRLPENTTSELRNVCVPVPTDAHFFNLLCGAILRLGDEWGWEIEPTDKRFEVAQWWHDYAIEFRKACANECAAPSERCRTYFPASNLFTWYPCSPYLPGCELPEEYAFEPFTIVGGGNLSEIIGVYGLGYQVGDVYTDLSKMPELTIDAVLSGFEFFPHITFETPEGSGTVKIKFLNIPQGGRALVSLDGDFKPLEGRLVELNKDLVSIPPETAVPQIYELEVTGEGVHEVAIYFLPTVDDTFIPLFFGGGIREIEMCGFLGVDEMPTEACCDETNDLLGKILAQLQAGFTVTANTSQLGDFQVDCTPDNFDEDEGDDAPTIVDRKTALCATVSRYIAAMLYVEAVTQNAGSSLKTAIKGLIEPLEIPDEFIRALVLGVPDEIPDLATLNQFVTDDPLYWEAMVCNMIGGLLGKENTFANFRAAVSFVGEVPAEEPGFIRLHKIQKLLMKTNDIRSNYVMFAKALDNALAEVQDEEFAYTCPCDLSDDGCGIPLELTYVPGAAYTTIEITAVGDNIYHIVQDTTEHVDSFWWAELRDANGQCLKFEAPPEGSGFSVQGVAENNYVDCADVEHNANIGGFAPIEAKLVQWKSGTAIDTYYKITCV